MPPPYMLGWHSVLRDPDHTKEGPELPNCGDEGTPASGQTSLPKRLSPQHHGAPIQDPIQQARLLRPSAESQSAPRSARGAASRRAPANDPWLQGANPSSFTSMATPELPRWQ